MIKEEYSAFKIIHHLDKIQELKSNIQPTPLQVQIVPANTCCQKCSFCAYRMKDNLANQNFDEKSILSYSKIKETLDCFKDMHVNAVHYTGGGEPLIHPQIHQIFKDTINNKLELALVTNGQLLTDETSELLGNTASWVRVSVDAGSAGLYSLLRNVSSTIFQKVLNNIKTLVKHRNPNCIIGIGFVVERENYREIYDAAKLFKELGVDNFRISAAFTPMKYDYFKDFLVEAKDIARQAETLSDDNFTVFNLFNDRIKDNFEGVQDYNTCHIKDLLAYIGADYNVYTCCTVAYNDLGLIGSIKDQSFKDLWLSKEKRDMFEAHNPSKRCKFPCMYKGKNEFINYCVKQNPKHVNFI